MSSLIFTSGSLFVGGAFAPFIWNRIVVPVLHWEEQGETISWEVLSEVTILLPVTEPFESSSSIEMPFMSEIVIYSVVSVTCTWPLAGIGL